MDKRYQVFVSSTYVDLKEERQSVLQTLMEMDCIPAGMELFPAADEEQWEFIKKVIDDCDYYLLIVGGRYGTTAEDGLSYTEKEFDYAVSKGIKVIALLHESPETLPRSKSEVTEVLFERLQEFREKVSDGRLVRYWKDPGQLPGQVALSLNKTIKMFPAVGWVRADSVASPELLSEINALRKRNDALLLEIQECDSKSKPNLFGELADWDSTIELNGTYKMYARTMSTPTQNLKWSRVVSWSEIFSTLSPFLADKAFDSDVNRYIAKQFSGADAEGLNVSSLQSDDQVMYTVRIQFLALGLIAINNDSPQAMWSLTEQGVAAMLKARVIGKNM